MFGHVGPHLDLSESPPPFCCPAAFTAHCLSAGSVPCLAAAVVAAAAEAAAVGAAVPLPPHPFHLHCQSINLQTIATEEKKC